MLVFWFLVLVLTGVLALILGHLFGAKVSDTADKIYKSFTEEEKGEETNE
jgi:hypothetical protein